MAIYYYLACLSRNKIIIGPIVVALISLLGIVVTAVLAYLAGAKGGKPPSIVLHPNITATTIRFDPPLLANVTWPKCPEIKCPDPPAPPTLNCKCPDNHCPGCHCAACNVHCGVNVTVPASTNSGAQSGDPVCPPPICPRPDPVDETALRAALEGYISPEEYLERVLDLYNFLVGLQEELALCRRGGGE